MVGNASEEGLLGQIGNPSHGDPLRVVALAAFVAGGLSYLLARWFVPMLTVWGGIVLGVAVTVLVAWRLARFFDRHRAARDAAEMQARRAAQVAETEARIAAMRAEGGKP